MANRRCILLYTRDPQRCHHWESWLAGIGLDTLPARSLLTMNLAQTAELPEIALVVTDEPVELLQLGLARCRVTRGEIGLVTIGCAIPADVNLPADVTAGELQLACRLLAQIVALRADVARERQHKSELLELVETDPLTKLPNRRAWDAILQSIESGFATGEGPMEWVVAILDIDGFKRCNDEQGHVAADDLLSNIAGRLSRAVRRQDYVARWGGDEFALLLADVSPIQAHAVVERIRQAAMPVESPSVTISAGWAAVTENAGCPEPDKAWLAADAALREAKQAGGDQTRAGSVELHERPHAAAG